MHPDIEKLIAEYVDHNQSHIKKLQAQIEFWVSMCPGEFTIADVDRDFPIDRSESAPAAWLQRIDRTTVLEGMVENGTLQRVGGRRGWYRPTQLDCAPMCFDGIDDMPVNIAWPFTIQNLVELYPGNIATLGGMKNSGKTAFLLNLAKMNRDLMEVHYFNSESGTEEMFVRLGLFSDMTMEEWGKVKFYERNQNFSEVIKAGRGKLNIIDFLECHDDFYKIGGYIRDIFDALNGAVAVIAIQQNPGAEDPIGGRRGTEKSRLHLKMSPNELEIKVGKNWASHVNPNGLVLNYKLRGGCDFYAIPSPDNKNEIWGYKPE